VTAQAAITPGRARAVSLSRPRGRSEALARVLHQAALVAPLDLDVLITGPSGTGKTALARAIVANSKRATAAFVH